MLSGAPSQTSVIVAVDRALHQAVDDKPLILDDPIAPLIVDREGKAYAEGFASSDQPGDKGRRTIAAVRARYAEDCLCDATAHGVRQYMVLGAGMDTFAYRQPPWATALRVYEVDHPASQALKMAHLEAGGIAPPANLVFVPVDFETQSLREGLRPSGFDFSVQTFCSWLGVTFYLTDEAINATLATLARLPLGSEVVLQFVLPTDALPAALVERRRSLLARFAAVGEPWISFYRPEEMIAKVKGLGFSEAIHFSPEEANKRYCSSRRDGLSVHPGTHLLRAIV